jgi:ATP-dependent Zn protease
MLLRVARHEAGHGLIGWLAGRKPVQISILARGRVAGLVESEADEERMLYTKAELESRIRQALGGRAAEILYYGEQEGLSSGAADDLRNATRYAELMVRDYGMDEGIGPLALAPGHWEQGPLALQVVQAVQRIVKDQMALALEELRAHRTSLDQLVEALQARNRLTCEELEVLLAGLS